MILSNTNFQFYSLGVYCKPPRLNGPCTCACTHCLPHLRHSNVLCRSPSRPLPFCSSLLQRRSLHFDQSDAIQLITFSTECLSHRPQTVARSSRARKGHREALARPAANTRTIRRTCSAARRSFRRCSLAPPLLSSLPDYGPFSARS